MASDGKDLDNIIDASLALAGERPWSEVGLRDIAQAVEIDLATLRATVSSKAEIITGLIRRIDKKMLVGAQVAPKDTAPRDALFEVLMSRFDAMEPYKRALKSIAGPGLIDPDLIKSLLQSQTWMLQAAGISCEGMKGSVRVVGLMSVYSTVFRTWLEDDDPGLARTMAALDRRLRRGERYLSTAESVIGGVDGLCQSVMSILVKGRPKTKPDPDAPTSQSTGSTGAGRSF